ncbi:MAG: hypothetical protein P8P49_00200 [Opitutales bacterium]|nr:hypothetical protein [Opitutales bacterium]MDG1324157.1 hypothetical protein [Opitutales bacterium]
MEKNIILKVGHESKKWLIGVSIFLLILGIICFFALGIGSSVFIFSTLICVTLGGTLQILKAPNIVITSKYISGGSWRTRRTTSWDKLGTVSANRYFFLWEDKKYKTQKIKTSFDHFGRVCDHNGRQVAKELAIEWVESIRDAGSEEKRETLIKKMRQLGPQKIISRNELSEKDRNKSKKLVKEYKSLKYRPNTSERKVEIINYFRDKGWKFPNSEIYSKLEVKTGKLILLFTAVFFVFFFFLLISLI